MISPPERTVYLAGPITNLSYEEAVAWREQVYSSLWSKWDVRSPMRGKAHLRGNGEPLSDGFDGGHSAFMRDLWDIDHSEVVLANLGNWPLSPGTLCEIGYAYANGKFIIVVMTDSSPSNRLFVREMASSIVPTVDDAVVLLGAL